MEHTQGKLHLNTQYADIEIRGSEESGVLVAVMSPWGVAAETANVQPGNARRLVACWNACDGISTETLELVPRFTEAGVKTVQSVEAEVAALKAQRDELLALLELLTLPTDEGDSSAMSTHYVAEDGHIRRKGSFLALVWKARTLIAAHKDSLTKGGV